MKSPLELLMENAALSVALATVTHKAGGELVLTHEDRNAAAERIKTERLVGLAVNAKGEKVEGDSPEATGYVFRFEPREGGARVPPFAREGVAA